MMWPRPARRPGCSPAQGIALVRNVSRQSLAHPRETTCVAQGQRRGHLECPASAVGLRSAQASQHTHKEGTERVRLLTRCCRRLVGGENYRVSGGTVNSESVANGTLGVGS